MSRFSTEKCVNGTVICKENWKIDEFNLDMSNLSAYRISRLQRPGSHQNIYTQSKPCHGNGFDHSGLVQDKGKKQHFKTGKKEA